MLRNVKLCLKFNTRLCSYSTKGTVVADGQIEAFSDLLPLKGLKTKIV